MNKTKQNKYPRLHPLRLDNLEERGFADEWDDLVKNTDIGEKLLSGPTVRYINEVPKEIDYDICKITGGLIPFPYGYMTDRDRMVVRELVQWLGSGVGMCFLSRALKRSGWRLQPPE